ncbi:unnamed protein product [Pleuronectes platessa]|uniref:Uncharacterized protein n=1 Tax=Pleuronectes platessa TaxID=8262 RepID=A0A9N7TT14_PLEPL|nr:unnamed protein product [Pleuronectes platessa]
MGKRRWGEPRLVGDLKDTSGPPGCCSPGIFSAEESLCIGPQLALPASALSPRDETVHESKLTRSGDTEGPLEKERGHRRDAAHTHTAWSSPPSAPSSAPTAGRTSFLHSPSQAKPFKYGTGEICTLNFLFDDILHDIITENPLYRLFINMLSATSSKKTPKSKERRFSTMDSNHSIQPGRGKAKGDMHLMSPSPGLTNLWR